MKRLLAAVWAVLSSRALAPLVIGFFFLVYIGIAFFSDETLTVLIALTGKYFLLSAILALVPLNFAFRIAVEATGYLKRRRPLAASLPRMDPSLYDETVEVEASTALPKLEVRLRRAGYRVRENAGLLAAWRGVSLAPVRIMFLATACCLFAGIVVSLTSRTVSRVSVIEGVPFQSSTGKDLGIVEQIVYKLGTGPILAKNLVIRVAGEGGGVKELGVYPPTLIGGAFAYPRYLGIALSYRFSAPDLPVGFENNGVYPIYPPGKEAVLPVSGSLYKIAINLEKPQDGSDPYMTGQLAFRFKLMKGSDLILEGNLPRGGEFVRDGFRFAIVDARRMVITDFVTDFGVLLIWGAGLLLCLAVVAWLPVRLFFPRREMVFTSGDEGIRACSLAEGRARSHAGVFHEALDFLAAKQPDSPLFAGD